MMRTARIASILASLIIVASVAVNSAQRGWDSDRDMKSFTKEDIIKTLKFADPGKSGEVIVDNVFGPITVEGYAGKDIVLEARKIIYARDESRAQRAEEEVRLDISENANTVEIYVDGPFRDDEERRSGNIRIRRDPGYKVHYGFRVKVPYRTDLVLSTVLDGDVEVQDVEGRFDVRNVNGKVRLSDIAGSGDARTVNGGVTVVFKRHPDGACLFKTINGDVEVDFPGQPSADFRVKTMHGEVYSDFDVTYLPKAPPVREERAEKGGKYVYRSEGYFGVRSGKGGPEIKLDTLTGDILIAKRSKSSS
jgi:ribosomal protein S28E/S33